MQTFGEIIRAYFPERGDVVKFVRENYPHITEDDKRKSRERIIRRYFYNQVVPSFETARELLNLLGIDKSEEELRIILDYSNTSKETREPRAGNFVNKLSISYRELRLYMENMTPNEIQEELNERVKATTKDNSIKEYIVRLIEKDLDTIVLDDYREEDK